MGMKSVYALEVLKALDDYALSQIENADRIRYVMVCGLYPGEAESHAKANAAQCTCFISI